MKRYIAAAVSVSERSTVVRAAVSSHIASSGKLQTNGSLLGARVHGAFGAFIPLGIKIGLSA